MTQTNAESPPSRIGDVNPDEPVPLEGDALPCGDCGRVVADPDPATVEEAEMVRGGRASVVLVAKCAPCIERDRISMALARRFLPNGVTRAGRRYAAKDASELLVASRVAIDAAGMEPTILTACQRRGAVLAIEIEHLGHADRGLRWRDRLSEPTSLVADPVRLVEPGTANPRPWVHLGDEDRAGLRRAVVVTLGERVALQAPAVALVPPTTPNGHGAGLGGITVTAGCLYCGVGSVTVTALAVARCGGADAAARSVWTQRQVNPATLGARRVGPSRLVGWLCPACEEAAVAEGSASSAGAVEGALSAFLGVSRRTLAGDELQVVGLKGWGGCAADALRRDGLVPPPNAEPWGHLSKADRDGLALGWRLGGS